MTTLKCTEPFHVMNGDRICVHCCREERAILAGCDMYEPTLKLEFERQIAEHEVFMSFVNDEDAELFRIWWNETGWNAFQKWVGEIHES